MTIQRMTIMFTVALSGCLLSTTATATTYSHISHTDKRPKLYPMAHTNQDDEEKRMEFGVPIVKETGLDGVGFNDPVRTDGLTETTIVATMPVFDTDLGKIDPVEPGFSDVEAFDGSERGPGFLSLAPTGPGFNSSSGGLASPAVPAPGVLTLLALAGLSSVKRRRR